MISCKFALSDDAQSIASDAGFYVLAVEVQDDADQRRWVQDVVEHPGAALPPNKEVRSDAVRYFMNDLRRLSVTFRFASGSFTLDTRAMQDIERLARDLKQPGISGRRFLLWDLRMRTAAGAMTSVLPIAAPRRLPVYCSAGAPVSRKNIQSLSYMTLVACNDSDAGNSKNRRVEVWIEP